MDFKELSKQVKEVVLGGARMTDISNGSYNLIWDGVSKIQLVSDKSQKVNLSLASLASLRIVETKEKAAGVKTTREARDNENYSNLQTALTSEKITLSPETKFDVVHRLQIVDIASGNPIYRNEHYAGYPAYVKASRNANAMPNVTDSEKAARTAAFTEASENLRASGLKAGVTAIDKNFLLMPVFTVTDK